MPHPRDGVRSAVYRSFVICDDPKGVAHCKTRFRKSRNQDMEVSDCITKGDSRNTRDCYDELRDVIRESFARQNLKVNNKDLGLCVDLPSSTSLSKLQVVKPKSGNIIARLMGLDEVENVLDYQRSRLLDIDLSSRPPPVVRKVVKEKLSEREGKCESVRKRLPCEGQPIVVIKTQRVPHSHWIDQVNTIKRRQMPRGVVEKLPLQVPKGRVRVTETNDKFRVEKIYYGKVSKDKEGRVHFGDKLSTKKKLLPKPLVPRLHKNEAAAKRIDDSPKLASNTRKQAGRKDAKTQYQGKITALKLISRTTRDSNVSKCQTATPEKKTKPPLSLSSVPKKNLRKANKKPTSAPVENVQNEGVLPINIESNTTQDMMMKYCYVSTPDSSGNAIDKNDMKPVEDGTCIPSRSLDETKGCETIYNTSRFLLSSTLFLSRVEELTDTKILQTASLHDSEIPCSSLLLDCAMEILARKSMLHCTWQLNPSSKNLLKSPKQRLSLRKLIEEISSGIEDLRDYDRSCSGEVHADRIYSMLERDVWWNEETTGAWDVGWKTLSAIEDVNRVVHDLEELVLMEVISDVVIEFMFG